MIDDTLPKPDADKLAAQVAELPDEERDLLARCIAAEEAEKEASSPEPGGR